MANLIITVIAIALVAVASLMGAYYGGAAFLNNQSAAQASAIMNINQQMAGAWQSYLGDNMNTPPTSLTQLVTGKYLAQLPQIPAMAGNVPEAAFPGVYSDSSGKYWTLIEVGQASGNTPDPNASACLRILKTAIGAPSLPVTPPSATANPTTLASKTYGNGTFGCFNYTSWDGTLNVIGEPHPIPQPSYVAFYRIQ